MPRYFQEHVECINRLLKLARSENLTRDVNGLLTFHDVAILASQAMWHLKDWILNDPHFGAADLAKLQSDIHASRPLMILSDIANGSKHLDLKRPKVGTGAFLSGEMGMLVLKDVLMEYCYVYCADDPEHNGMEIRDLLERAWTEWQRIIDDHYLSRALPGA